MFKPHAGRAVLPLPVSRAAAARARCRRCSEAGVLGAVTGVMGTLQATEVLKEILGIGESLSGRLLIWDALATRFRTVRLRPRPGLRAVRAGRRRSRTCRAHARRRTAPGLCRLNRSASCCCPARMTARTTRSCCASGAAALGRQVVLFATNARLPRAAGATGPGWRMPSATRACAPRGVAGLDELREAARELGVRLIACEAGLRAEGAGRGAADAGRRGRRHGDVPGGRRRRADHRDLEHARLTGNAPNCACTNGDRTRDRSQNPPRSAAEECCKPRVPDASMIPLQFSNKKFQLRPHADARRSQRLQTVGTPPSSSACSACSRWTLPGQRAPVDRRGNVRTISPPFPARVELL